MKLGPHNNFTFYQCGVLKYLIIPTVLKKSRKIHMIRQNRQTQYQSSVNKFDTAILCD